MSITLPCSSCFRNPFGISPTHDSVNIGGWFVLEPFTSPALFQRYAAAGAVDEWTISTLMAADTANGGLGQLENHYDTFIVRQIVMKLHVWHALISANFVCPISVHHVPRARLLSRSSKISRK